jgi:thioredoxin 1
MRRLSKLYIGRVAFGKLNIEENQNIAKQWKIQSIPTFNFFHFGKKVGELYGIKSTGDMKERIERLLNQYGQDP